MDENAVYIVQFWVDPDEGHKVIDWLRRTHLADVAGQPGFLWARMFELEQTDEDGWPAYMMTYGLESREALDAYFESDAPRRYARERSDLDLDRLIRANRFFGKVARRIGS